MLKKYKKLPIILSGLAGVALLTTGFSTWIIQNEGKTSIKDVNVTVGTVSDRTFTIAEVTANSELATLSNLHTTQLDKVIKFDADDSANIETGKDNTGLIAGQGDTEDLDFTVAFKITAPTGTSIEEIFGGLQFQLVTPEGGAALITNNHIVPPTLFEDKVSDTLNDVNYVNWTYPTEQVDPINFIKNDKTSKTYVSHQISAASVADSNEMYVVATFGFNWGTLYGNCNPVCDAYPDDPNNPDDGLKLCVDNLTALQALNDKSFTLNVKTLHK